MFLREDVRHCEACGELTSHARRVVAAPAVVAAGLGALAVAAFAAAAAEHDPWLLLVAIPAGVAAVAVWRWDRDRFLWVACGRCRGKRRLEDRRKRALRAHSTERFLPF